MRSSEVFREGVDALLAEEPLDFDKWAHDLREAWRQHLWARVARDRPQHYNDAVPINVTSTMALHDELVVQAVGPEDTGSLDGSAVISARCHLSLLRRLLAGGLLTNDRTAKHRGESGRRCQCGAEQTVLHVSWECPLYHEIRTPLLQQLPMPEHHLPTSCRYAGVISEGCRLPVELVKLLQMTL
eukprot:4685378-Amphidinium_carterae.1